MRQGSTQGFTAPALLAEAAAREESEVVASERGAGEIGDVDVIHGWIRVTPPEQRNSLVAVIESLGYDPAEFADELEAAGALPAWSVQPVPTVITFVASVVAAVGVRLAV